MRIILILFAAMFLTASSCNDETIVAVYKGTIMGQARRYTELAQVRSDNSGITVTLQREDDFQVQVTTGSDGKFTFGDIEPGVYDIICSFVKGDSKDDTAAVYSYQFSGNGTAWVDESEERLRVIKPAVAEFSNITAAVAGDTLRVSGTKVKWTSDSLANFHFRIFMGTSSGVSKETGKYTLSIPAYYDATDSLIKFQAPLSTLKTYFVKGSRVYLTVYPGYSLFFQDYRTDKAFFSGLGKPSDEVSFTMP